MSAAKGPTGTPRLQRESTKRVLDEATRQRRARKALESLEKDNHNDDPHANLVMSKKALSLFQEDDSEDVKKAKKKTRTSEYYKHRFRKNFSQLLEEDAAQKTEDDTLPRYLSAQAPESSKPQRHFCAVCGFPSLYTCTTCGTRYCSLRCQETHLETRCLKWTA